MRSVRKLTTTALVALGVLTGGLLFVAAPALAAGLEVYEEEASVQTPFEARFHAGVEPRQEAVTYFFEYATSEALIGTPGATTVAGTEPFFGESVTVYTGPVLEVSTIYYYRAVVTNTSGETARGKIEKFSKKPAIDGESASGLTSTGARLEAKVNPNYQETAYRFEYSTEGAEGTEGTLGKLEGMITTVDGESTLPAEAEELPAGVKTGVLQPGTTYYYRVVAENGSSRNEGEPVDGPVQSFTTLSAPIVTTGEAQNITRTTATFSGTINPGGEETTYYFAYIDQAGYEKAMAGDAEEKADPYAQGETTAPLSTSASYTTQAIGPILAGGLLPETTYHFSLVASNQIGSEYGEDHTFTTAARVLPGVSTGGVSGIGQNSAMLSGTVSANGLQTNYGFEIGTEPGNYGPATGLGSIGGALTETVTVPLGELQPGTTYYYRITASNADGTTYGEPQSFTTPGFPTLIAPPASPPLIATPNIAFPKEEKASGTTTKSLTNKEKLAKALKACKKDHSKSKRQNCEKQAHAKYGATKKKKASKK